jgi:hypothetical protein
MKKRKKKTKAEKEFDRRAKELRDKQKNMSLEEIHEEKNIQLKNNLFDGAIEVSSMFGLSGVYYLFDNVDLVYIGESECMMTRLSQHVKEGVKTFTHYKLFVCDDRKKREKKAIKKHRPVYNATHNPNVKL